MLQLLEAITYIHARNIAHLDIKVGEVEEKKKEKKKKKENELCFP